MKLILAVVSNDDAGSVANTLTDANFQITKIASTGGFLKTGNTTIIVGCEDNLVDKAIEIIGVESKSRTEIVPSSTSYDIGRLAAFPISVKAGGAVVFVLDIEKYLKF